MLKLVSQTTVPAPVFQMDRVHLLCDVNTSLPPVLVFLQLGAYVNALNLLHGVPEKYEASYFVYYDGQESFDFINNGSPYKLTLKKNSLSMLRLNDGRLINVDPYKDETIRRAVIFDCYPDCRLDYSSMEIKYFIHYNVKTQTYYLFENMDFKG